MKKKIAIICVIFICAVIIAVAAFSTIYTDRTENTNVNIVSMNNENANNVLNEVTINNSTTITTQNISQNENNINISQNENNTSNSDKAGHQELVQSESTYESQQNAKNAQIDSDRAKENALNFLTGFLNYNASTLANGVYTTTFQKYLAMSELETGLITQHMNVTWQKNSSTYKEVICSTSSIEPISAIFSVTNNDQIVVCVNVVVTTNIGDANEFVDWQQVNISKRSYGVYMNTNYEITDLKKQSEKTITENVNNWQSQERGTY